MIHHVSVGTNDVRRSKRFYDAVLPIVGIMPMAEDEGGLGYGSGTFHFSVQVPIDGRPATVGNGTHIAFAVEDRSMVAVEPARDPVSLSTSRDRSCFEARDRAAGHLRSVREKIAGMKALERCDIECAGGPAAECVILEDLAEGGRACAC